MASAESDEVTRERIRSRTSAEEWFALLLEEATGFKTDEAKSRFWSLVAYRIAEHTGQIQDEPPKVEAKQETRPKPSSPAKASGVSKWPAKFSDARPHMKFVTVELEEPMVVKAETEKAIGFAEEGESSVSLWVPISQLPDDRPTIGDVADELVVSKWWADKQEMEYA